MYCGQCGKKVLENMLFCPFCGSPIVIPDQDEPVAPKAEPVREPEVPVVMETAEEIFPDQPRSLFEDAPAAKPPRQKPVEEFVPLSFDFNAEEEPAANPVPEPEEEAVEDAEAEPEQPVIEEAEVEDEPEAEMPRERRPALKQRPQNGRKRNKNTYIPVKDMDMNDIFMDGDDEDEYDLDEDEDDVYEDDYEYEEREHGSFFQRHIRGFVALILMLVLVLVFGVWAFSSNGQLVLARVNLAWSADAYADLAYEFYQQDSDLLAARYYSKALDRDPDNYVYAHSSMVAYYEAEDIPSSTEMLKKCIDMQPDNPEPYQEMMILYPDPATRPWEISELIRMGYQRTGDASLNVE